MYTSTLLVALFLGLLPPVALDSPAWQTQYDAAQKMGRQGGKPLAVFIGSGKAGWNQLLKDGQLDKETNRILSTEYICLYIDATAADGKQLAAAFQVTGSLGLVISDSTGKLQAFRYEGQLAADALARHLRKYADRERVVQVTEGTPVERAPDEAALESQSAAVDSAYFLGGAKTC